MIVTKENFHFYPVDQSIFFRKTKEQWGGFSNMCAGFALVVNDIRFASSEILYQACRFPDHPSVQLEILTERNPMVAKMIAKENIRFTREGWDSNRISIMKWCVFSKLCQNWDSFYPLLDSTENNFIVEHSEKDTFWGAKREGNYFKGVNALGRILMFARDSARKEGKANFSVIPPLKIPKFYLLGKEVRPVLARDKF